MLPRLSLLSSNELGDLQTWLSELPVRLGPRSMGFVESEVQSWIRSTITRSRAEPSAREARMVRGTNQDRGVVSPAVIAAPLGRDKELKS